MNQPMNQTEVMKQLQTVFDGIFFEPVKLTPQLSAKEVEEWDSLLQISIIVAVEATFKIKFRVGEVETTKNVGELANLILKRVQGG